MFQGLATYFLGGANCDTDSICEVANGSSSSSGVALRTTDRDDGWIIVDLDSDGSSEVSTSEEEANVSDGGLERVRLDHNRSTESLLHLQRHEMEESWFVTPPPCFSSQTGPVQLRTSPLENLLIEHPSMSVYQRGNRNFHLATPTPSESTENQMELVLEDYCERSLHGHPDTMVVYRLPRNSSIRHSSAVYLNDMDVFKDRRAQQFPVRKWPQQETRRHLNRSNKVREVNGRNWNPRRSERSQGLTSSHANNNRKC